MSQLLKHSFLQTDLWGSFRESLGWHAHKVGDILVLERPLPGGKSFLYSPEVSNAPEIMLQLLPKIHQIAKERQSIFYRLELLVDKTDSLCEEWQAALHYTQFVKAFESIQPDDRQIVPLGSQEKMLADMKQKGRYNVRLAQKAGVTVRQATAETLASDVKTFYSIFKETAKRDKFTIRPESYFEQLCQLLYEHNAGQLFIASFENEPLAAAIITLHDGAASYLYGASSNRQRQVMAPYAMHWEIMQWAAGQQAEAYDLLAIRPPGEKKHAYDGITRFKQQFGGESVHVMGSWDLVFSPLWYTLFKVAEKVRR